MPAKKKKDRHDKEMYAEESFKGFVVSLNVDASFETWLKRFLFEVKIVCGIVQKLIIDASGNAHTFTHKSAREEKFLCETAVLNALQKMGIKLEPEK